MTVLGMTSDDVAPISEECKVSFIAIDPWCTLTRSGSVGKDPIYGSTWLFEIIRNAIP